MKDVALRFGAKLLQTKPEKIIE
jgi:D-alanyl-D-alanine carboxypeptidase/D-alanyl-D-alanine-endopeptidase (penicillin-binding protein 4)